MTHSAIDFECKLDINPKKTLAGSPSCAAFRLGSEEVNAVMTQPILAKCRWALKVDIVLHIYIYIYIYKHIT